MSDDPRTDWYVNLVNLIAREAAAATADGLFACAEAMHVNLVGAAIEHLIVCCETIEDLERAVQIVRAAEALALDRAWMRQARPH
jgi:hypothetical protein